jgi:AcrR family transcriptional regulator
MSRHLLETAIRLMQEGIIPSVSDVAEAGEVSRATAYRHFPSQAALVQAVVDAALGPVLEWRSDSDEPAERVASLFASAFPRLLHYEATHRAALSQALDQWARRQAGTLGAEAPIVRGKRKALIADALSPLAGALPRPAFDKLAQSLSLIFGIEAIIVLKDIWGLDDAGVRRLALWAAAALVGAAMAEAAGGTPDGSAAQANDAAARPRGRKAIRQVA